jgi:ABC-type phosphate transport system permease subunit
MTTQVPANYAILEPRPAPVRPPLVRGSRRIGSDLILRLLASSAAIIVLLMLASLVAVLAYAAVPSMKAFGFKFLVSSEWRPNELEVPKHDANGDPIIEDGETVMETLPPAFGALPVIYGTAVSSVISLLIAVPLSLGAALFLVRIAPRLLAGPVSFLIEFLAAIPSIAYGIWGLFVLGPFLQGHVEPATKFVYDLLPAASWVAFGWGLFSVVIGVIAAIIASRRAVGRSVAAAVVSVFLPLALMIVSVGLAGRVASYFAAHAPGFGNTLQSMLGSPPSLAWMFQEHLSVMDKPVVRQLPLTGRDMLCGAAVLAVMILPIITAISRDVLRSVPRAQIEATVALGATWWQSSWEMLRYCRSGLFGAVMLGLARAAGETMAITMVIGNNNQIRASLFAPAQTMSSLLANEFAEASTPLHRAALTEVALVLLLMSLLFNIVARYLVVGKNAGGSRAQ